MTTATTSMVSHAKQRAAERYGVHVNRDTYYSLVRMIETGKSEFVRRTSNDRTVHKVDGMICVYSKKRHKIVTFLPEDCREVRMNGR